MEKNSDKGGFWKRQAFLLPPLTAAVVLLCQQMVSSHPSGVVTVNILLLVLNFFSYVGLLRGEKSTEKSVAIAAAGFITLMAFVFNTCVAEIPTPLSNAGIFINSLCGMWVLVAAVQGISLLIQAALQQTAAQETETNIWDRLQKAVERLKPQAADSQGMILTLLRLATVLLAIVSWWSTAQGMRDYVFSQAWQANLASFAIQSILLGLNFYLPTFWRWIHSLRGKICVLALSGVVLFCSSWFSYVFIVGTVYEKSWQTESRLLVQSVYRNELYKADEFVQISSDTLRETLGDEVAALYAASKTADTDTAQNPSGLDLAADKASYADDADFAAKNEIASAIQAMQTATQEGASSGVREQAAAALTQLTEQVETRIEQLTQQVSQTQDALTAAAEAQNSAASALRNAPYGSNTTALQNAYSSAASRLSNLQDTMNRQQQDLQDYQQAQGILQRYAGVLGIAESAASVQTGQALRSIQSALLQTDVDTDAIEQQARAVFEQLQAAQDSGADADFQTLLNDMDSFIRKVQDYAVLKASGDALQNQINSMAADTTQDTENWEPLWTEKLELLKATISGLPVSDSGQEYDRADALDQLDDAQRLYISEHNPVDQALIYLGSPYCQLAVFSLILAFFLDIAAFITGLVIDVADRRKMSER